jgi:hypothetical protein
VVIALQIVHALAAYLRQIALPQRGLLLGAVARCGAQSVWSWVTMAKAFHDPGHCRKS